MMRYKAIVLGISFFALSIPRGGLAQLSLLDVTCKDEGRLDGRDAGRLDGGVEARLDGRDAGRLDDRVRIQGRRLVDSYGREVILRGANVGAKSGSFLPEHQSSEIHSLVNATGVNFVRLYIHWHELEKQALVFNEEYADRVETIVEDFNDAGVYVLIDMHQDVWGAPFSGSGAPKWASLGLRERQTPMTKGLPWQAQYLDRRVYLSFHHFWNNESPKEGGVPLQEHYSRALGLIVERLAGEDMVLGYDLMNEPFMGEEIEFALDELSKELAQTLEGRHLRSATDALGEQDQELSKALLQKLIEEFRDKEVQNTALKSFARASAAFEKRLAAFYERVGKAVKAKDEEALLFIEPMALAGVGMTSYLPKPALNDIVYTPHLYDCFMDSGLPFDGSAERVLRALKKHEDKAEELKAPLLLGEWGNLHGEDSMSFAETVGRAIDSAHCGSAYWAHEPGLEKEEIFCSAFRPYPRRVAGELEEMHYRDGVFHLTYRGSSEIDAPTVIALPSCCFPGEIAIDIQSNGAIHQEVKEDPRLLMIWSEDFEVRVKVERKGNSNEC